MTTSTWASFINTIGWSIGLAVGPCVADINRALTMATSSGDIDTVRSLLQLPETDVNAVNEEGWTSLALAAAIGREDLVMVLLEAGAATNVTVNGQPLLELCVDYGQEDIAKLIHRWDLALDAVTTATRTDAPERAL